MGIRGYHSHHHDGHEFVKHKTTSDARSVPYMGIELEVDKGGERDDVTDEIQGLFSVMDDNEFIYFESDGSINNGFEIITNPATLNFHSALRNSYETMFRYLVKKGYRSFNTNTCGFHIHVNRNYFGQTRVAQAQNIKKVLLICDKFWDNMVKFSRRDIDAISRWAEKYSIDPENVIEEMNRNSLSRYRYLNLCNTQTIEFRMFRGTLNPLSFYGSLELVNNICVYAKTHSEEAIRDMHWEELLNGNEVSALWDKVKNRSVI